MKQPPIYVLNHSQHNFRQRSTQADLNEIEEWTDRAARRMYEGAGLSLQDVDIFNPYDGYSIMAQFFLEAFQWHGEAWRGLRVLCGRYPREGSHPSAPAGAIWGTGVPAPLCTPIASNSSGALRGRGRSRSGEIALAAFTTPSNGGWIMFGKYPS